jgi:hypothetical protein
MHETLKEISVSLQDLAEAIDDGISNNEPMSIDQSNWSFPGVTRNEISERVLKIKNQIDSFGSEKLVSNEKLLADYPRRLDYIRENTIAHFAGNANVAYGSLDFTLTALEKALVAAMNRDPNAAAIKKIRNINSRLRSRQAQLDNLDPKFDNLGEMIERIENAHNSADQLPTDLESLKEARAKINDLLTGSERDNEKISEFRASLEELMSDVAKHNEAAEATLQRCQTAYSAATSVGLAAAFSDRSRSLSWSVWIWTGLLVASLGIAGTLGFWRIQELATTLNDQTASDAKTILQFLLSLLSVGAPVWFAWLSTRQIGQRFRLAEDYAFKASVSQAYEGYRREAARIDADMEHQLLGSALARLDEQPLRLVESESHSSPMNELVSSSAIQKAIQTIPNFTANVRDLAMSKLGSAQKETSPKPVRIHDPEAEASE